jgi:hypothetical protein
MSNAKQCNRCGKYYELIPENLPGTKIGPKYSVTYYKQLNALGGGVTSVKSFDLCPECARQLTEWAENPGSVALSANKFDGVTNVTPEETEEMLEGAEIERAIKLLQLLEKSKLIRRQ